MTLAFGTAVGSLDELGDCDLIVAADGVNSLVRRALAAEFGTSLSHLDSKFVWYGTTRRFETLTQTFVANELGTFNAHHYRYAPGMSTFIVECDPATWVARRPRPRQPRTRAARICEQVFAATLQGHPLDLQPLDLAQFPVGLERALVVSATWC